MAQAALLEEPDYFSTDMHVGDILRRARKHYGQSVADIERGLRIRASQIEAIENNRLELLPGQVYAIGFVRSYAEYLGLDGDRIVSIFKEQSIGIQPKPELHFPVAASESKVPSLLLILFSLIAAFSIITIWAVLQTQDRTLVTEIPPVPIALKEHVAIQQPIGPPAPSPAQLEEAAAKKSERGIILNIKDNSWVEIRDSSGKAIVSKVLKAGDQYFVPDRPDLQMSLGNAGGVEVLLDGEALPSLGKSGTIRRDIPLGREALQNLQTGLE